MAGTKFTLGDTQFDSVFEDDFDNLDSNKWAYQEGIISDGKITVQNTEQVSGNGFGMAWANNDIGFPAETDEWAYLVGFTLPTDGIYGNDSNRFATILRTDDVFIGALHDADDVEADKFGIYLAFANNFTSISSWSSGFVFHEGQSYVLGVHKTPGADSYDIYVDDLETRLNNGDESQQYSAEDDSAPAGLFLGYEHSLEGFVGTTYDFVRVGAPVPEPASITLMCLAMCVVAGRRRSPAFRRC